LVDCSAGQTARGQFRRTPQPFRLIRVDLINLLLNQRQEPLPEPRHQRIRLTDILFQPDTALGDLIQQAVGAPSLVLQRSSSCIAQLHGSRLTHGIQRALDIFRAQIFVNLHQAALERSFFFDQFEKLLAQRLGPLFGLAQQIQVDRDGVLFTARRAFFDWRWAPKLYR
jgi:hypothetical protein